MILGIPGQLWRQGWIGAFTSVEVLWYLLDTTVLQ